MKRFLPWLLAIVFVILATGCSAQGTAPDSTPATPPEQSDQSAPSDQPADTATMPPAAQPETPTTPAEQPSAAEPAPDQSAPDQSASDNSVFSLEFLQQATWTDVIRLSQQEQKSGAQVESNEDRVLESLIVILSTPLDSGPDGPYKAAFVYAEGVGDLNKLTQKVNLFIELYNSSNQVAFEAYPSVDPRTEKQVIVLKTANLADDIAISLPQPE